MARRRPRPVTRSAAPRPQAAAPAMLSTHDGAANDLALGAWQPVAASADTDLLTDLPSLVARSRDLARNNGLMSGGMQTLRDNIVGATLHLSAMPDYRLLGWSREQAREWGNQTEAQFRSWADTTDCDAANTLTLLGLTLQGLGNAMLDGDALALPMWLPRAGSPWGTRLMMVESDRLATPLELRHRDTIRGGIEFDRWGAPVAYYVLKHHPGDLLSIRAASQEYERVPALTPWGRKRVIHLHDKERTGQSRGKPIVTAVMRELRMAGKYASNELEASLANSLVAAFLESDLSPDAASELFGQDPRASWNKSLIDGKASIRKLEGAAVIPLPVGARLSSFTPGRPNQAFEAFMLASLRHIAAGLNLPYELLVKDFSKTNYSSARAALLEAWRYFSGRRRWLSDTWLRAIYELWLEEAINTGRVEAPGYYDKRYAYSRAKFIFGGRGWIDPVKEAQASVLRMAAGLSTLERECAEQGDDFEDLLDQQAAERDMREERGLSTAAPETTKPSGLARRTADQAGQGGSSREDGNEGDDDSAATTAAYHHTLNLIAEGQGAAA